jgi:hypothetical protein
MTTATTKREKICLHIKDGGGGAAGRRRSSASTSDAKTLAMMRMHVVSEADALQEKFVVLSLFFYLSKISKIHFCIFLIFNIKNI